MNETGQANGPSTAMALDDDLQEPRVTIKDVATAAGVSPSTVSRAFARPGRVNAQTARRIRAVADQLGYRTQNVRPVDTEEVRTGQIAFVVSDLGNPIFSNYVKSAQHESLRRGYCMLVIDSEESRAVERRSVEFVRSHVDGIVLGSSRMTDVAIRKLGETIPLITINRPIRGVRSVIADVRPGLQQAIDHLLALGHHRITYVSGPDNSWQEGTRWQSMLSLSRAKSFTLHRVHTSSPTYSGGYDVVRDVLATSCTAVVAYNDLIATGVIAALTEKGISVPEQVSVVGIDDIPLSSLLAPKLSTIHMPSAEVSARAVSELVSGLHRVVGSSGYKPVFIDSEFASRQSVAEAASSPVRLA